MNLARLRRLALGAGIVGAVFSNHARGSRRNLCA
jgi:hypothetical protein